MFAYKTQKLPKTYEETLFLKESLIVRIEEIEESLTNPDLVYTFYPRKDYTLWHLELKVKLTIYCHQLSEVIQHLLSFEESTDETIPNLYS